jgi:hypothetical protein
MLFADFHFLNLNLGFPTLKEGSNALGYGSGYG